MNNAIALYDTTLRDGAQTVGVTFTLDDKLRLTRELDEFGVHYIEGGWPGSNPKDMAYFTAAAGLGLRQARLTAFGSTRRSGLPVWQDENVNRLLAAAVPVIAVFGKSWDLHTRTALRVDPAENLQMIFDTIAHLKKYAEEVVYDAEHFFDGFRANPEYALQTLEAAAGGGGDWLVLCDTNGGALPREVEDAVRAVRARFPGTRLGIHCHNDGGLAVANTLAAVSQGAEMVQGTINGLGERCGNADLCSVLPNLQLKMGFTVLPPAALARLTSVSRLVDEMANQHPDQSLPFVGARAFAHKGGVHVSAVRRDPRTYEHIPPETVGNHRRVTVSELSGRSNILEKARQFGLEIGRQNPLAGVLLQRVKELEHRGYHFEGADASLEILCRTLAGHMRDYFVLDGYRVLVWRDGDQRCRAEATIKARVPGCTGAADPPLEEHTSADGNGPVEALDKALRKVFGRFYPRLAQVRLLDYKVRILNGAHGTRAVTRVWILSGDGDASWGTVGVSENIIEASWQALVDAMIYKLLRDDESPPTAGPRPNAHPYTAAPPPTIDAARPCIPSQGVNP